jgi:hypothetical protein
MALHLGICQRISLKWSVLCATDGRPLPRSGAVEVLLPIPPGYAIGESPYLRRFVKAEIVGEI